MDPTTFFEAVAEYDKTDAKGFNRCGTIDPGYAGSGPARVLFDGETTISQKSYQFIGTAPVAGRRVVLMPVGSTYVILGMINGGA